MNPSVVFLLRLVLSVLAAYMINQMYFGYPSWGSVAGLAVFMLLLSYTFEAIRNRKKD